MTELTTADELAMMIGGSFIVIGTVIMGILEAIVGNPSPVPVTNDAGAVVAATTVPVEIRAYLIALGLLVWLAVAVYKVATPLPQDAATTAPTGTAAK